VKQNEEFIAASLAAMISAFFDLGSMQKTLPRLAWMTPWWAG